MIKQVNIIIFFVNFDFQQSFEIAYNVSALAFVAEFEKRQPTTNAE
jgi:hypothetical protein